MSARALINVPKTAKRGEVIEIKTLISHVMETGYRHSNTGVVVPRDIITSFSCKYNGEEIFRAEQGDSSEVVRTRVMLARERQAERLERFGFNINADIPPPMLEEVCGLTSATRKAIERGVEQVGLSARGVHRVMRVSRTIADLAGEEVITEAHVVEAAGYRVLGKKR